MVCGLLFALFSIPCFAQELPSSVDLRPQFEKYHLQAKSQGGRGTCSVCAVAGVVEYELVKAGAPCGLDLSEEYINWASHHATGRDSDGTFYDDAITGIQMYGACEEWLLPYAAEFNAALTPSPEAMMNASGRRNIASRWIKYWDVNTGMTDEMLQQVKMELVAGYPVIIGMRWPDSADFGEDFRLKMPPEGKVFDGHSVIIIGYEDDTNVPGGGWFIFRNHNGPDWGEAGTAWMPYEYARLYGNDALAMQVDDNWKDRTILTAHNPQKFAALKILTQQNCDTSIQDMSAWGAPRWHKGTQLFCNSNVDGLVSFEINAFSTGRYEVNLYATRAPDFGIIQVLLDDIPLGTTQDLFTSKVTPTGCLELGEIELTAGAHTLTVQACGQNPASSGVKFGLDCIDLILRDSAE